MGGQEKMDRIRKSKVYMDSIIFASLLLIVLVAMTFVATDFDLAIFKSVPFWVLNITAIGAGMYLKSSTTSNSSITEELQSEPFSKNTISIDKAKEAVSRAGLSTPLQRHIDRFNDGQRIEKLIQHIDKQIEFERILNIDYTMGQLGMFGTIGNRLKKKITLTKEKTIKLLGDKTILSRIFYKKQDNTDLLEEELELLVSYTALLDKIAIDKVTIPVLYAGTEVTSRHSKFSFNRSKAVSEQNRNGAVITVVIFLVINSLVFGPKDWSFAETMPYIIKIITVAFSAFMGILAGKKVFVYSLGTQENRLSILSTFLDRHSEAISAAMGAKVITKTTQQPKPSVKQKRK